MKCRADRRVLRVMVAILALGCLCRVRAEDVVPPAVDADDIATTGPKPLWEAGIGAITGALADYPGSNQYRVRALPLPYFVYRGDFFKSDANGPRLQASSGSVEWELSGGGSLSSNSKGGARAGIDVDNYDGAANVDSPLLRVRNDVGAVVGFAWSIKQSTQQAHAAR